MVDLNIRYVKSIHIAFLKGNIMQPTKKITKEVNLTQTNEHGEIIKQTEYNVVKIPSEPPYIKLYIEDLANIYQLPKSSPDLLLELLKKLDYEGLISLNHSNKKQIAQRAGKAVKTLNNFLQELLKKDIFRRVDTGVFKPNPHLFGKGEWREIYRRREAWLKVSYTENGERTIDSSLSNAAG